YFNGKPFKLQPRERYFNNGNKRMHTYVWEFNKGKVPKGCHVHHKNENTWDNRIENLEIIEASKHHSYHIQKRFRDNPDWAKEFHAKGIEASKEWHASKEGREWHSKHGKQTWENRESRMSKCT